MHGTPTWKGEVGNFQKSLLAGMKWNIQICTKNHISKPCPSWGGVGGLGQVQKKLIGIAWNIQICREWSGSSWLCGKRSLLLGSNEMSYLHEKVMSPTLTPCGRGAVQVPYKNVLLGITLNIQICTEKLCMAPPTLGWRGDVIHFKISFARN